MGKPTSNPTITVLIVGSEGVGKDCLESRFTTNTFPPPYNPALTLNSRRYITLAPKRPAKSSTPGSSGHSGIDNGDWHPGIASSPTIRPISPRADSRLSIFSSQNRSQSRNAEREPEPNSPISTASTRSSVSETVGAAALTCTECSREANTYLVEVINNPTLQSARTRQQLHARREYDAVLLVYDVGDRPSFDAVPELFAELPLTRKNKNSRRYSSTSSSGGSRTRSSWFSGGGDGGGGGTTNSGIAEPIVVLIGNKADVDEDDRLAMSRRGELQPLYRDSAFYDDLNTNLNLSLGVGLDLLPAAKGEEKSAPPEMQSSSGGPLDNGNSSASGSNTGHQVKRRRSVLLKRDSSKALRERGTRSRTEERRSPTRQWSLASSPLPPTTTTTPLKPLAPEADIGGGIEHWLMTGEPAQHTTASNSSRTEKEKEAPLPPSHDEQKSDDDGSRRPSHNIRTNTTTTSPPIEGAALIFRRRVARLEGEALARRLEIPFLETSAKTGSSVEEAFEAVIRDVLKAMGRHVVDYDDVSVSGGGSGSIGGGPRRKCATHHRGSAATGLQGGGGPGFLKDKKRRSEAAAAAAGPVRRAAGQSRDEEKETTTTAKGGDGGGVVMVAAPDRVRSPTPPGGLNDEAGDGNHDGVKEEPVSVETVIVEVADAPAAAGAEEGRTASKRARQGGMIERMKKVFAKKQGVSHVMVTEAAA